MRSANPSTAMSESIVKFMKSPVPQLARREGRSVRRGKRLSRLQRQWRPVRSQSSNARLGADQLESEGLFDVTLAKDGTSAMRRIYGTVGVSDFALHHRHPAARDLHFRTRCTHDQHRRSVHRAGQRLTYLVHRTTPLNCTTR